LKFFKKKQIIILKYESLRDSPRNEIRKIYNFLGVNPNFISPYLNSIIGKTINPRFRYIENTRIKIYNFLKRNNLAGVILLFKKLGLSSLIRSINDSNIGIRNISKYEYNYALDHLIDDITLLQNEIDFDISDWLVRRN